MPLDYSSDSAKCRFGKKQARARAIELVPFIATLKESVKKDPTLEAVLTDLIAEHEAMCRDGLPTFTDDDIEVLELYLESEDPEKVRVLIDKSRQEVSRRLLRLFSSLSDFGDSIGQNLPRERFCERYLPQKKAALILINALKQH